MFTYSALMEDTSVSAAKQLINITAPSDRSVTILRAWVASEVQDEATEMLVLQLLRTTTAGTGTAYTAKGFSPTTPSFGGSCRVNLTADGTGGDVLVRDTFNVLSGWLWIPTPEERPTFDGGDFFALKLVDAPAAATALTAGIVFAVN